MILNVLEYLIGIDKIKRLIVKWNTIAFIRPDEAKERIFFIKQYVNPERVESQLPQFRHFSARATAKIQNPGMSTDVVAKLANDASLNLDVQVLIVPVLRVSSIGSITLG